ncbi:TPA: hypothetical protein NIE51_005649 [Pseudomonas aeruginosa]|nr:hypothetical protein [Pseudomonas aeruginosa]HDQ4754583.1 hypothetical protein [Pseudomonas aeruginosa]
MKGLRIAILCLAAAFGLPAQAHEICDFYCYVDTCPDRDQGCLTGCFGYCYSNPDDPEIRKSCMKCHDFISQKADGRGNLAKLPARMPHMPVKQWLDAVTQAAP